MTQDIFSPWGRAPLPPNPVTLLSQDEMVARIERIRADEAPQTCPTCNSTTAPITRRCNVCRRVKDLYADFHQATARLHGRAYICKSCKIAYERRTSGLRRIIERALRSRAS